MPLGIIFKNENCNEEMLSVLQQFHTYLPKKWNDEYDGQLFAGDQLSVERAVNTISSVANGYTAEDRLEGINLQLGDWHASVKLLTVSVHMYRGTQIDYKILINFFIFIYFILPTFVMWYVCFSHWQLNIAVQLTCLHACNPCH